MVSCHYALMDAVRWTPGQTEMKVFVVDRCKLWCTGLGVLLED